MFGLGLSAMFGSGGGDGVSDYEINTDVIILAYGQSNEQGANLTGNLIDAGLDQDASGRIRRWDATGGVDVAAVQPLTGWPSGSQQAPLRAFKLAQELLARQNPAKKVVIVNCAVGGAKLTGGSLGVGGATYTTMISRMTACLAAFPGARVFMSWTQGEEDANDAVTAVNYTTAFNNMLAGVRAVAGAAAMEVFLHQMVPERFYGALADLPYRQVIDAAHKAIPLNTSGCIYVPASFGTQIDPVTDPSHFTAQGHRNAGTRAAAWLNRIAAWQAAAPATPAAPVQSSDGVITITVPDPQPPAYVVEYRAAGSTGAYTEQVVFPQTWVAPGDTFSVTVGGSGAREVRLRARSYAGTSSPTASISVGTAAPPVNTALPAITGTPTEGQTLTASTGTWTGSPSGYTYAWERGGTPVSGATASTYLLQAADVGASMTVVVTATNADGSTSAGSNAVGPVAAAPSDWWTANAYIDLDYENDRAYVNGTAYASIAAARTAGAIVQTGGIDRVALPTLAASYAIAATGVTGSVLPGSSLPQYLVAIDDGADGAATDQLLALTWSTTGGNGYANVVMYTGGTSQLAALPSSATSILKAVSTACRLAARAKANSTIVSVDGTTRGTDTSCTPTAATQLVVGNRDDGLRSWAGTIRRIVFVNAELTEAQLNGLLA